ncbi:MAG: type IV pilus assembly protein PilM [Bdellovibrionales bacterium]|nr:type IV pilus assembly protein PilM [Bdellovibrionales bacterium]
MGFLDKILGKKETLVSVDIGNSCVKLLEFDLSAEHPKLINVKSAQLQREVFENYLVTDVEHAADVIAALVEESGLSGRRIVTSMPGPSVFTKKVKMAKAPISELAQNIQFEAASFIPHSIDAVKLDFHVLGQDEKGQLDVLVVAVKNEIIDSFLDTLSMAGLETAIVDVDYFAFQNMFELSYPEYVMETVALIDVGHRYSSVNICSEGKSLFTGDISVGTKDFIEPLKNELEISMAEAQDILVGKVENYPRAGEALEIIDRALEQVVGELNRQLSFFWNASGAEEGIDRIMVGGGGSAIPRLIEELSEKTGVEAERINSFRSIDVGDVLTAESISDLAPIMGVAVGLGIRQPGDKEISELD